MRKDLPTVPISTARGNGLFEKAVAAVALDDGTTRWLLLAALNMLGATPAELTPDELGHCLPEVERRLRQLVQEDGAADAVRRLQRLLLEHEEA